MCFSFQTEEGCEILLGPEVTYGPLGLDLSSPVAMTIAHCAEVDTENWNIQLKRKTQDNSWEVREAPLTINNSVLSGPVTQTQISFFSPRPSPTT